MRDGSDLSRVYLAAKNAADLVCRGARFARRDWRDDGNVSVCLGDDRTERGGIRTRVRF